MAKSLNTRCVAEPIMTFGGSPTIVPEPPILERRISAIKVGIGVTWIRRQREIVMGVMRSTAVTASMKEAQKPVIKPRIIRSSFGRPFEIFTDQSAIASKKPDFFTTPIKIIMPDRRPMVLKSMKCRSAISCVTNPLYTTSPAPRRAQRERGILSDMIPA